MLLNVKPEYRSILIEHRQCTDVPRSTPPHIVARLTAGAVAFCEKRSVSTFDELLYQDQAKHFHAQRPQVVDKRKAAPAARTAKNTLTAEDRRCGEIALQYRALSYAQIRRAAQHGYSTDMLNALNLAELGKQFRYEQGSTADAEQKFRDDEGKIYPEVARTKEEHEESAEYHANCARKAKSLADSMAHYHASDRHKIAAEHPNDVLASDRARTSSGLLRQENSL
jgi:hypothetical protein